MLQNLRIGLRKRRSGKSKVPAKQRGSWPKMYKNSKEKNKATFLTLSENRCLPASTLKFEEREFVVDFDKFPSPSAFACWKTRFKIEVCACSQFPTEVVHWIKEVEMVDSVDELKS